MSAKRLVFAMVAGTALVILAGARHPQPPHKAPVMGPLEAPWLSREAAAQIVGPDGTPGPLFADAPLGGPAPSPAVRARIAEFARANHVEIDLDVDDFGLAAVRFAVSYGGCCGYEGADVLAMRLSRPQSSTCCGCGRGTWIDDWANASDGIHMRARVRVNRVEVRWQRTLSLQDLLDRADQLLGMNAQKVGKVSRGGWFEIDSGHQYVLAMPYLFLPYPPYSADMRTRYDLGPQVTVDGGLITEVSFTLGDSATEHASTLRAHWGKPTKHHDGTWTWRKADRIIIADLESPSAKVTIQKRATTERRAR